METIRLLGAATGADQASHFVDAEARDYDPLLAQQRAR
jgi:hypothetical protein